MKTLFLFCLSSFGVGGEEIPYQLSIGAIFQDEAPYLKEWIEFHKLVGVEHFYLYNNCSRDDYLSVLQSYIDAEEVELFEWPLQAMNWENWIYEIQPAAYQTCVERAIGQTKWLALIDIDEFLTPISQAKIPPILKEYEEFGGVCFNWKIFGHSWLDELPAEKLLIESLVWAAPPERATNLGIKSIVRPECVKACSHPHYVFYKEGFYHVNSAKAQNIDKEGRTDAAHYEKLVVNHYWSRTSNYLYKKLLRYSAWVPHIQAENWREYVREMNEVRDHTMEPFVAPLRKQMGWDP